MTENTILQADALTKQFGSGPTAVFAVQDVSLGIERGELVLIMGPSGSGKTTLLSMLGGLLRPSAGSVVIGGVEITKMLESELPRIRAQHIGFIFQAFNLLEALTVEENVLLPAELAPGGARAAKKRAAELLEALDLTPRRRAYPATLSGGEKQRAAIARALINRAPLVLADEPTGNLDTQKGQEVTMILHDIARDQGASVVLVTHDPRIEPVADRILWLEDGCIKDRKSEVHTWAQDPVCNMPVDAWATRFSATHAGQRYAFCSKRCQERFEANPNAYLRDSATTSKGAVP